ncbi:TerB family tellurite resistance protein [Flavobacterium sp. CS20]|jgi:DnaJ like chaperone protein|uniref:TerB family tellurite resistance protein n=1 Tax=Flavobacterium sp. CS20 TaxID=2775246 RepID=UPI001B3A19EB|nr:TerB family tellurite resistance protein [Flavobacterium sp. CS20]QTY26761.1 TerB family tellurite resistance protein [Flavobacterium sp. CS20]
MLKWVGAIIGFFFRGFVGALAGYLIGSMLDLVFMPKRSQQSFGDVFQSRQSVSPGDFELNLLSLASLVIKADGSVSQKELDYVRGYFVQAYGKERANATFKTFNEVIKKRQISASNICQFLRPRVRYEVRLQIIHFLFNIGQADGHISEKEINKIHEISRHFQISYRDFESIKAMFVKSADEAYKILEIDEEASDAEIKKAYRKMVKKYHPDKLQNMDEAYQKGAKEKFNKVQEAYEQLQKERGF